MPSASTAPTTAPDPDAPSAEEGATVLVIEVGDASYALPVADTREVLRAPRLQRVPGSGPACAGIVNVRGRVVTVLDLRVTVGAGRGAGGASVVLVEHGARLVGLRVDRVRDVRALAPVTTGEAGGAARETPALLDARALCARYLMSAEEAGR